MSVLRTAWWKWLLSGVWLMIGIWFTWNLSETAAELRAEGLKPPSQFVQFIPLIILSAPVLGLRRFGRWLPLVFVVSMLLAALMIAPLHIGYGMIRATQIRTDPAQYQGVLTKYLHEVDLVAHFPSEIPKNAKDVRFSFQPRFLMGGLHIYLRYKTDSASLDQWRVLAEQRRNPNCDLRGIIAGVPSLNQFNRPFDQKSATHRQDLPEDFDVYFFDEDFPEMRQEEWVWNHGSAHGIAISRSRGEILFWAEYW